MPDQPGVWLLDRFTLARAAVGLVPPFDHLTGEQFDSVANALDDEVTAFAAEHSATLSSYEPGVSTVVIEFARGGPEGTIPPLPEPHGYAFALRYLSPDILGRALALYVWVTPQESHRRNRERSVPGLEGDASILHHGVPETVMRSDYGVDDVLWLLERGGGDTIEATTDDAPTGSPLRCSTTESTTRRSYEPTNPTGTPTWCTSSIRHFSKRSPT